MFLQCTECTTRFIVQDNKIGSGRIVRCGVCKYEWFQDPSLEAQDSNYSFTEIPDEIEPMPDGSNVPVVIKQPTTFLDKIYSLFKSISLVYLLALVISVFFLSQDWIVSNFSPMQRIYNIFALYDSQGLALRSISAKQNEVVGVGSLVIKGFIENSSDKRKHIPSIYLKAYNKDGKLVASKIVRGDNGYISAHDSLYFSQSLEQLYEKVDKLEIDMGNPIEIMIR